MSVQVVSWVLAGAPEDLKPAEMLVAISLANHASSDGGHAYPSVQVLMAETRLSRRAVQCSLRSLTERGVIEVEREPTRRLPAMYAFCAFRGANPASLKEEGAQLMLAGAQTTHSGAQILPVRGAENAPKPSEGTDREPPEEPSEYPPPAKRGGRKTSWDASWRLSDEWRAIAIAAGEHPDETFTDFVLRWTSGGETKADWTATWRHWVRRAPLFRGGAKNSRSDPNANLIRVVQLPTPEEQARLDEIRTASLAKQTETSEERWARRHPEQAAGLGILRSSASATKAGGDGP